VPSEKPQVKILQIDASQSGQRIDNYLINKLKGVPKSHIYRLLRSGQVRVNSGRKKPHYKLKSGDFVRIPPLRIPQTTAVSIPDGVLQALSRASLFENEDILVINKPAGLPVHGGSGVDYGLIEAMRQLYPEQPLELVHRLDRDTSGCLILAKNRTMLTRLHELLRNEKRTRMGKYYLALVAGRWNTKTTIDARIKKSQHGGERIMEVSNDGLRAISHFEPVKIFAHSSLMQVAIDTGRTHQIRVHAAQAGHAIVGDSKYGDTNLNREMKKIGLKRLFLHASRLELPLHNPIIVEAPLSHDLQQVLDKLQ